MAARSRPDRKSARKAASDDIFGEPPRVTLIAEKQWLYIRQLYHLSPREIEVSQLVCRGLTNRDIAELLNMQLGTAKTHLKSIFSKTRTRSKITLLLRFLDDIDKLFGKPAKQLPIPIAEVKKPGKKLRVSARPSRKAK